MPVETFCEDRHAVCRSRKDCAKTAKRRRLTRKVDELQDVKMKKEIEMLRDRSQQWLDGKCSNSISADQVRPQFLQFFAAALGRTIFVQDRWVLAPLIDSLELPGTSADPDHPAREANCRVELEDMGGGQQLLVLVTSRSLEEGDVLVRDIEATPEQMLLQYGRVIEADAGLEISLKAYVAESSSGSRVQDVQRLVQGAVPGRLFGDVIVPGLVKPFARFDGEGATRMDDIAAATGNGFLKTAMILAGTTFPDIGRLEADQVREMFASLAGSEKRACLQSLLQLMKSCLGEFPTSLAEDEKLLRSVRGCRRLAVAFRQQRKQALRLGLVQLLGIHENGPDCLNTVYAERHIPETARP